MSSISLLSIVGKRRCHTNHNVFLNATRRSLVNTTSYNRTTQQLSALVPATAAASAATSSRFFSSENNNTTYNKNYNSQKYLERVIYRQLLRWCNRTDPSIPLSSFVESEGITVYSKPYNEKKLNQLSLLTDDNDDAKIETIRNLLPAHEVRGSTGDNNNNEDYLWIPVLKNSNELRHFFRALYRLNDDYNDSTGSADGDKNNEALETSRKERTSQAFQTLRSLNELNQDIKELKQQHDKNSSVDRDEADQYHVGQVVQHKQERWRGIIVGWEVTTTPTTTTTATTSQQEQRTSLTTKTYSSSSSSETPSKEEETTKSSNYNNNIRYQVILDSGDMNLFMPRAPSGLSTNHNQSLYQQYQNMFMMEEVTTAYQNELVPITDSSLSRIRSNDTEEYFLNYDTQTNSFVMNELLSYKYPKDGQQQQQHVEGKSTKTGTTNVDLIAKDIIQGVQDFSKHLLQKCNRILSQQEEGEATKNNLNQVIATSQERLSMLSKGDIIDPKILMQHRSEYYRHFIYPNDDSKENDDDDDEEEGITTIQRNGMTLKIPSLSLASMYLRQLVNITLEVRDILWHRETSKRSLNNSGGGSSSNKPKQQPDASSKTKDKKYFQFQLGDVVEHKLYGFRGVVVAWDPKPVVNVLQWDGIQDLIQNNINPMEIPFYHVIPDQRDCIDIFGSERPIRYVCEENLVHCRPKERVHDIRINFEDVLASSSSSSKNEEEEEEEDDEGDNTKTNSEDNWEFDSTNGKFTAPFQLKFKHGEDVGDNGITEAYLTTLQNELTWLQVLQQRGGDDDGNEAADDDDDVDANLANTARQLSLNNLFELLRATGTVSDAAAIEETIKEIWKAHEDNEMRFQLDAGINNLVRWKYYDASKQFKKLVQQDLRKEHNEERKGDKNNIAGDGDEKYAEAWNKLATCEFMLGREANNDETHLSNSVKACERALEITPNHFQALNGMGLVHYEQQKYDLAAEAFRQSLDINPWSPVSSKFSACIDLIENEKKKKNGNKDNFGGSSKK